MAYRVRLLKQNTEVMVSGGTLAQACALAGYPLNAPCGGNGKCKKCLVKIVSQGKTIQVLACKTPVRQNLDILLEEENILSGKGQYLEEARVDEILNPSILRAGPCYGLAVDLGSTSVVIYIYDLHTGCLLHTASGLNRQAIHGADVIARIQYAAVESGLHQLQEEAIASINKLIASCLSSEEISKIYHVVLCGNSVMQYLFFGWQPEALGRSPYVNVTTEMVEMTGIESGLLCAPDARIEFLPLLGGFVGADTLACLLALPEECFTKNQITLLMDLGTNGELALLKDGKCLVCSTACGPALEGGQIACGMRAEEGAIDRVDWRGEKLISHWIGQVDRPAGLCGSGIIDLIAGLLEGECIDHNGTFTEKAEQLKGMDIISDQKACILQNEKPRIYLTQGDIRQIQMAKSAVITGVNMLLAQCGISLQDIDALYLAGAFGNYISVKSAQKIGLLPAIAEKKIHCMGNGAGAGVQKVLLNQHNYARIRKMKECSQHIILADADGFQEEYIKNINFFS